MARVDEALLFMVKLKASVCVADVGVGIGEASVANEELFVETEVRSGMVWVGVEALPLVGDLVILAGDDRMSRLVIEAVTVVLDLVGTVTAKLSGGSVPTELEESNVSPRARFSL